MPIIEWGLPIRSHEDARLLPLKSKTAASWLSSFRGGLSRGADPQAVVTADFNGDGSLDVATGTLSSSSM